MATTHATVHSDCALFLRPNGACNLRALVQHPVLIPCTRKASTVALSCTRRPVQRLVFKRLPAPSRISRTAIKAQCYHHSYPFNENEYLRLELLDRLPYGPMKVLPAPEAASGYSGVVAFQREHEATLTANTLIIEVFVAGDSACNIHAQLHGQTGDRSMVHHLLYNILARAAEVNHVDWQLLRVAIVGLQGNIFLGRLFFGDSVTGTVHWDCDCRPSDGIYLSLRTQCPFYVARGVWKQVAIPLRLSKVYEIAMHEDAVAKQRQQEKIQTSQNQVQQQDGASSSATTMPAIIGGGRTAGSSGASNIATLDYLVIKPNDLEDIRLLKRELAIAVREEDFTAAARLRDHPYMQLYRCIESLEQLGRMTEAGALKIELLVMIERNKVNN